MKAWDILRQQHAELLSLAREIMSLLEGGALQRDSTRTRLKLATWARKLRVHLTLEERLVYPRLQRNPRIAQRATQHQADMRVLRDELTRFTSDRLVVELSESTPSPAFVEEAKRTFATVATKFQLEENELYGGLVVMTSGAWTVDAGSAQGEPEDG